MTFVLRQGTPTFELRKRPSTKRLVSSSGGVSAKGFTTDLPELVKTDDYTQLQTDRGYVITFNKGTSVTYTLLAAATAGAGYHVMVKNIGAGTLSVDPDSSELINGAATLSVPTGADAEIWCTGTAWRASISFDPSNFDVNGGTIDGTAIGGTTPAAGAFTTLSASGVASFADGAAGTPSITFANDGNTGLYSVSADVLGVAVGGNLRGSWNQYGLGVYSGVPDANYVLDVAKNQAAITAIRVINTDAGGQAENYIGGASSKYFRSAIQNSTGYGFFISNTNTFFFQNTLSAGDIRIQAGQVGSGTGKVMCYSGTVLGFQVTPALVQSLLPLVLPSYTVAGKPSASAMGAGARIYITNESGGATPAFSDGTDWRRDADRAVVS